MADAVVRFVLILDNRRQFNPNAEKHFLFFLVVEKHLKIGFIFYL